MPSHTPVHVTYEIGKLSFGNDFKFTCFLFSEGQGIDYYTAIVDWNRSAINSVVVIDYGGRCLYEF